MSIGGLEAVQNKVVKQIIKDAAKKLTGLKRRIFQANTVNSLLDGNTRQAEREFGWGRKTVEKGINELLSGFECLGNFKDRGNKKTEFKLPNLEQDIREIVEPHCQVDPKFQTDLIYTRITAKAVRQSLIDNKGYKDEDLPTERTILNILNRMGYTLKKVIKAKPKKKIKEVDEIFDNVHQVNSESDSNPESLRISIDTKAEVKIGELSRGGKSRGKEAEKAQDHDTEWSAKLKPVGILDVVSGLLTIFFANSLETSDLIVDVLLLWWEKNKHQYTQTKELVINLDNGPHNSGRRTQFLKRIIEFSDQTGLRIRLAYYPPYHSKYNAIERCWGILENHWNGTILDSIDKTLKWAGTMTWKGISPVVEFIDKVYDKGVKLTKAEMDEYNIRLSRSAELPKWDLTIEPQYG